MIEQKLLVDRFINLSIASASPGPYAEGAFVTVAVQSCFIQQSTGIFTKQSNVQQGASPKAHRNFRWLPWLPKAISEVPFQGVDVLTGPMSGCWLVIYRRGGVVYAGHLGTDVASPSGTAAVKSSWNGFVQNHRQDVIAGFNPLSGWNGAFPASKGNDQPQPRIFGLMTSTYQLYSVITYQQKAKSSMLRIAGVQQVVSTLPTFT